MADTIDTFTAVLANDGHGFNITISAPGFTTFTLTRAVVNGGASSIVRGAKDADLSGVGAAYLLDVEVPQNTAVQYLLVVSRVSPAPTTVTSAWVTATGQVDHGGNVIFDLTKSSAPTVVRITDWAGLTHDTPNETVWVDGRADPVVISTTRRLPSSDLVLLTLTEEEYEAVMTVTASGITCVAPRYPMQAGMPKGIAYLSVGNVLENRMTQQGGEKARYLTLQCQEIAPPPADYIAQTARTWDEAYALGLTWDVLSSRYTWDELAYG